MKKVLAILLVLAIVLSIVGCSGSTAEESETVAPVVTAAPVTVAPVVTESPTETPEATEAPEEEEETSTITLKIRSSSSSSSSSSTSVTEWDGIEELIDSEYKITLTENAGEYSFTDDSYSGTLNVYTDGDISDDITIDMENATINYYGKTTGVVTVTSGLHTFKMKEDSSAKQVVIAGGNAILESGSTVTENVEISSDNKTTESVEIGTNAVVTVDGGSNTTITTTGESKATITNNVEGTVINTKDDSSPTITNNGEGVVIVATDSSAPTIVPTSTNTYVSNQSIKTTTVDGVSSDVSNGTDAVVSSTQTTTVVADNSSKDTEIVFVDADTIVPYGYTMTIDSEVSLSSGNTITNYGTIINNGTFKCSGTVDNLGIFENNGTLEVADASGLAAAMSIGGAVKMISDIIADVVIESGVTVTLDLNGKTLTNEFDHTITNNGTLTIEDSQTGGTVDNVTNEKGALYNSGVMEVKSGTFERSLESGVETNTWYTIYNSGQLTISGATILNNGDYSSTVLNEGTESSNAVLIVDSGKISGGVNTIRNTAYGDVTINGGELYNTTKYILVNYGNLTIAGGDYSITDELYAIYQSGTMYIDGNISLDCLYNLYNSGTTIINENAVLTSSGRLFNVYGTIHNKGKIINDNYIYNYQGGSSLINDGEITNNSVIYIYVNGIVTNNGAITNNETITNKGTITNNGDIENNGTMSIEADYSSFANYGTVVNNATITTGIYTAWNNAEGATIKNYGEINFGNQIGYQWAGNNGYQSYTYCIYVNDGNLENYGGTIAFTCNGGVWFTDDDMAFIDCEVKTTITYASGENLTISTDTVMDSSEIWIFESGSSLTIGEGIILEIPQGATITMEDGSAFYNTGKIKGDGEFVGVMNDINGVTFTFDDLFDDIDVVSQYTVTYGLVTEILIEIDTDLINETQIDSGVLSDLLSQTAGANSSSYYYYMQLNLSYEEGTYYTTVVEADRTATWPGIFKAQYYTGDAWEYSLVGSDQTTVEARILASYNDKYGTEYTSIDNLKYGVDYRFELSNSFTQIVDVVKGSDVEVETVKYIIQYK